MSGLRINRYFTRDGVHPFDKVSWELRDATIVSESKQTVFEQRGVEIPSTWSQMATNVVVQKYFRGPLGSPERETSVRQLVGRVADTITRWGDEQSYFASQQDRESFRSELTHLLIEQKMAFNSPVWFNVGVENEPQCSACFINSVDDTMESILGLCKTEGMLFKGGSGTGTNFSNLRSSKERLSGGGHSSGVISFMKGFDAFAGIIKSGGKTRRAAKMVILNVDHPDIVEYIQCKAAEERKAGALIDAGYDGSFTGEAYGSVFFQNSNNSVRVNDLFIQCVLADTEWRTRAVTTGDVVDTYKARALWRMIAEAAHQCGDPGLQFDSIINRWNTCKVTAAIRASNPCVTGDTLVATKAGPRRIDSLLSAPQEVVGADGVLHPISPAFQTGVKPIYRLTTKCGYELKLTADHKVRTHNRGDVPVHDLTRDDRIQLGAPIFGDIAMDERLAELMGLALGDGCISEGVLCVTLAPEEEAVAWRLRDLLQSYKDSVAADGRGRRPIEVTSPQTTLRVSTGAHAVLAALAEYAVLDQGSAGKALTPLGMCADQRSARALLRGLFTADGTVADYRGKSQYVSLDLCSVQLLRQVQQLLLAFGIKAKLYSNRRVQGTAMLPDGKGGTREYPVQPMYSLRISRSSRLVFEREIGFVPGSPKGEQLRRLNAGVSCYADPWHDTVKSVEYLGEEPVYDLTEPVTDHFVANGLVVHNCSEYMFLDDSACNLASLNLRKFQQPNGQLDEAAFEQAVEITFLAQEIMVGASRYPTEKITQNSHAFRPLGLGYANLGALLMSMGLPYDSDEGRAHAGYITALMGGLAYRMSAKIAGVKGAFSGYAVNRECMLDVIKMHWVEADALARDPRFKSAERAWFEAYELGQQNGFRNAQATVLAPTGTIGFLMDCDTTGIEPDIALIKYKRLVGGGMLKMVNQTVPEALERLGYDGLQRQEILNWMMRQETIEGAPGLKPEHLPVFDCAFRAQRGTRSIHYTGHLCMMAAAQPFLSGAISKTVNLPGDYTVEDIEEVYLEAWRLGLKAVAVYRDGCKRSQPLSTSKVENTTGKEQVSPKILLQQIAEQLKPTGAPPALRRRLPDERKSLAHKFSIAGHDGYLHIGLYDDGTPGEMFVRMAKEGSTISGLMDSFATTVSLSLQHGVPLKLLCDKFTHTRFEPSGWTNNAEIRQATSLMDYIFRWLNLKFGDHSEPAAPDEVKLPACEGDPKSLLTMEIDAPTCHECGTIMVRNGSCHKCHNCGSTSGCS